MAFLKLITILAGLVVAVGLAVFVLDHPGHLWPGAEKEAIKQAEALLTQGKPARARQAYEEFIRLSPDSDLLPEALFQMASIDHLHLHQYERALAAYRHLVNLFPAHARAPQALERMADLYLSTLKDYGLAVEILEELKSTYAGSTQKGHIYQDRIAYALFMMEDYPLARQAYRQLIKEYPSSDLVEPSLVRIADTYYVEDNLVRALEAYREAEAKVGSAGLKSRVRFRIANCLEESGRLKEALGLYKGLLETYDNPGAVRIRLEALERRLKKGVK